MTINCPFGVAEARGPTARATASNIGCSGGATDSGRA
ncbi:Mycobacterium terramassiliense ORFan [Mycobacterium terramassiliense]|uniref:Mycobacterium terramassiliense ORFan n=1 Tax=Mycobacterium terramassiliense TaxID=1841859 RepID=A0A2U3N6A6_9MYCO|nr:Mycobacterium terramassiliense ORFan [Mycobacterium terramassiliense]